MHTKGAEAGERYYGMPYVKTLLDGLSGYSRVWRVTAPQYDPDWYDTIWALRKVCSVRLDSNRPFKAAALCPVTVASQASDAISDERGRREYCGGAVAGAGVLDAVERVVFPRR